MRRLGAALPRRLVLVIVGVEAAVLGLAAARVSTRLLRLLRGWLCRGPPGSGSGLVVGLHCFKAGEALENCFKLDLSRRNWLRSF